MNTSRKDFPPNAAPNIRATSCQGIPPPLPPSLAPPAPTFPERPRTCQPLPPPAAIAPLALLAPRACRHLPPEPASAAEATRAGPPSGAQLTWKPVPRLPQRARRGGTARAAAGAAPPCPSSWRKRAIMSRGIASTATGRIALSVPRRPSSAAGAGAGAAA